MTVPASVAGQAAVDPPEVESTPFWIDERYRPLLRRHGLDSLDGLLAARTGDRLDKPGLPGWRQRIRMELEDANGAVQTCYLKRYETPPLAAQMRRWWSGGRRHGSAWLEWSWLRRLRTDGVRVPEPIAFAERMRGLRELSSAVLTASVPGESLEQRVSRQTERVDRSRLMQLAEFIGRFHGLGYVHRDLYLAHVFDDGNGAFHLIDFQRVMTPRWRRGRWLIKDLSALHYSTPLGAASRVDRVRFLRRHRGVRRLRRVDKRLIRSIEAKARAIARREQRRGRLADWQRWLLVPSGCR